MLSVRLPDIQGTLLLVSPGEFRPTREKKRVLEEFSNFDHLSILVCSYMSYCQRIQAATDFRRKFYSHCNTWSMQRNIFMIYKHWKKKKQLLTCTETVLLSNVLDTKSPRFALSCVYCRLYYNL